MTRQYGSGAIDPPPETPEEKERRIRDEILTKVQTDLPTYKLYNENMLFRRVVDSVARGKDPWDIILLLIEMDQENRDRMRKLLEQWPLQNPPML